MDGQRGMMERTLFVELAVLVLIPTLLFTACMILVKLPHISGPQFPVYEMGVVGCDSVTSKVLFQLAIYSPLILFSYVIWAKFLPFSGSHLTHL